MVTREIKRNYQKDLIRDIFKVSLVKCFSLHKLQEKMMNNEIKKKAKTTKEKALLKKLEGRLYTLYEEF